MKTVRIRDERREGWIPCDVTISGRKRGQPFTYIDVVRGHRDGPKQESRIILTAANTAKLRDALTTRLAELEALEEGRE